MLPYEHTGLKGGDYRYRVFAKPPRHGQASDVFSGTAAGASAVTVPGAPTDLKETVINAGQINLEWTTPESDGGSPITGYRIVVATLAGTLPSGGSTAIDKS